MCAAVPATLRLVDSILSKTGVFMGTYEPAAEVVTGSFQTSRAEGGTVTELVGIARFEIHEGKVEEFKRLSDQAMEIVKTKDTGTLRYDTYFNDDESECVILELYRDSRQPSSLEGTGR